jgi:SAM-dependent methyltransferase
MVWSVCLDGFEREIPMDAHEILERKEEVTRRFGPWTAHCIHLGHGIYTFDPPWMDARLRRFVQVAADAAGQPLDALRVLDLACLEGHFGIEFARHGSRVVAIEGREANLAKTRFARDVLALDNLEVVLDDVRNFGVEKHGSFDVVLCLGILYHLDTPDVMEFAEAIARACTRVTIIDTHISLTGETAYDWRGRTYRGTYAQEHDANASVGDKRASVWRSIDNCKSFLFTRPSLCNLLRQVGFTSVYECLNPYEYHNPNWPSPDDGGRHVVWKDRITLVAMKGQPQALLSSPVSDASAEIDHPERPEYIEATPITPKVFLEETPR